MQEKWKKKTFVVDNKFIIVCLFNYSSGENCRLVSYWAKVTP